MTQPRVSFAFINCNRLHYLKSAVESFHESVKGCYDNIETIIIDNSSEEVGTDEYLTLKEKEGCKVWKQPTRDPSQEFARALNKCHEIATGEYVATVTGDLQFVLRGRWLNDLIEHYSTRIDQIGCIVFDAQRKVTHESHRLVKDGSFFFDPDRYRVSPWSALYHRKWFDMLAPWSREIKAEGLSNLELDKVEQLSKRLLAENAKCCAVVPMLPPAIAIYSEDGPAAKVRMNRRYGTYEPPHDTTGYMYYAMHDYSFIKMMSSSSRRSNPYSIEEMARPIGWKAPLFPDGTWNKGHLDVDNLDTFRSQDVSSPR